MAAVMHTNHNDSTPPTSTAVAAPIAVSTTHPRTRLEISICDATEADVNALAEIRVDAFRPSILDQRIFGQCTREAMIESAAKYIIKAIKDPKLSKKVMKAIIPFKDTEGINSDGGEPHEGKDNEGGLIVGVASWDTPVPKDEAIKKRAESELNHEAESEEKRKELPEGCDYELAIEFFSRLDLKIDDPHYHLSLLAINPAYQGRGIGQKLVRWGCEKADQEGLPMYLEASDVGVKTYESVGFEPFRSPITAGIDHDIAVYPMKRPIQSPTTSSSATETQSSTRQTEKKATNFIIPPENPIRLIPATVEDCPRIARIHRIAFEDGDIYQNLFGKADRNEQEKMSVERFRKAIEVDKEFEDVVSKGITRISSINGEEASSTATNGNSNGEGVGDDDVPGKEEVQGNNEIKKKVSRKNQFVLAVRGSNDRHKLEALPGSSSTNHQNENGEVRKGNAKSEEDQEPVYDNELVGIAFYELPGYNPVEPDEEKENGSKKEQSARMTFAQGANVELANDFFQRLGEHFRAIALPHIHLHILGTDPKYQRTGAGTALLQWGIQQSDAAGVDLWLDSTPAGKSLYEKFGFVSTGEPIVVKDGSFSCQPMVYRSGSGKKSTSEKTK